MNVLNKRVLVLNKHWLAVNTTTVEEAVKQIACGAVVGLDLVSYNEFYPLKWDEWIKLPIRATDDAIRSPSCSIRAPVVIIAHNYGGIPKSVMKFSNRNVKALYKSICQYSGEYAPDGNVDHIIPLDKGGTDNWENVVWSKRSINSEKGNRYNHQVGLPNIRGKRPIPSPIPLKVSAYVRPDWIPFLMK